MIYNCVVLDSGYILTDYSNLIYRINMLFKFLMRKFDFIAYCVAIWKAKIRIISYKLNFSSFLTYIAHLLPLNQSHLNIILIRSMITIETANA